MISLSKIESAQGKAAAAVSMGTGVSIIQYMDNWTLHNPGNQKLVTGNFSPATFLSKIESAAGKKGIGFDPFFYKFC